MRRWASVAVRVMAVLVPAVLVVSVAGCTSESGQPRPTPEITLPLSPPAPQDASDAYRHALAALYRSVRVNLAAFRRGDGRTDALRSVSSGDALRQMSRAVAEYARKKYRVRGDVDVVPQRYRVSEYRTVDGSDIPFGQVKITSCWDYGSFVVTTRSGAPVPRTGPTRSVFVSVVQWDPIAMDWLVSAAAAAGRTC